MMAITIKKERKKERDTFFTHKAVATAEFGRVILIGFKELCTFQKWSRKEIVKQSMTFKYSDKENEKGKVYSFFGTSLSFSPS